MQTCHGLRDKFLCRKELGDVLLSGCSVGQAYMLTFFRATAMLGRRARPVVGLDAISAHIRFRRRGNCQGISG